MVEKEEINLAEELNEFRVIEEKEKNAVSEAIGYIEKLKSYV